MCCEVVNARLIGSERPPVNQTTHIVGDDCADNERRRGEGWERSYHELMIGERVRKG